MISTAIKAKREAKGWSKKYLGDLIGVSSAAIGQYEKGDNKPKVEVLLKLNKVFGYDFINDKAIDILSESDNQLSQKSNIDLKEIVNKSSINNENEVIGDFNLNDAKQVNHKLTYDENSTFPERGKAPYNEWRMLYFNQQEQIRLLNKQVELLNQIIQR